MTLSGTLFITLSAKSLLHYRGGCLLHYRLNLLHYREILHYRSIFITLSGSITLSGVYYIIGCNKRSEQPPAGYMRYKIAFIHLFIHSCSFNAG